MNYNEVEKFQFNLLHTITTHSTTMSDLHDSTTFFGKSCNEHMLNAFGFSTIIPVFRANSGRISGCLFWYKIAKMMILQKCQ